MDLRIGICDDKPEWLEKAGDTVKRCAEQMQKKVEMYFFQNGSELLKEEHPKMHILFMDIEMPGESGIDLAMEVNRKWPECRIIYLTNYWSYAMDDASCLLYRKRKIRGKTASRAGKGDRAAAETEQENCFSMSWRRKSKSETG